MLLEAISKPIKFRLRDGRELLLHPGVPTEVPDEAAHRLLLRAGDKVRLTVFTPIPPLQAGWLVAWRDRDGRLRGGLDERETGTVRDCRWADGSWTVTVIDGTSVPLSRIASVGRTNAQGQVVAAWTTGAHGYDGEASRQPDR